jgi:hypothetical protein
MPCEEELVVGREEEGVIRENYIGVAVHAQTLNLVDDSLVITVFGRGLHALNLATHVLEEVLGYRSRLVVCRHCCESVCE